jgi:hypothetical protein
MSDKPTLTFRDENTGIANNFLQTLSVVFRGKEVARLLAGCPCGCPEVVYQQEEVTEALGTLLEMLEEDQ